MQVVITGASRGIGAGMAQHYRDAGAQVLGTSRAGTGELAAVDVTNPADLQALAEGAGGVDLLVCNAGVYLDKGHSLGAGYAPDLWDQTFAVNVKGVFLTVEAFLPNLREVSGKIAIISSVMASDERAPGGGYIYRASKAAVLNLGRNLAQDLRGDGVAVGIYHPGWVRTEMGGEAADISVEQSVAGLVREFDALSMKSTGVFHSYDGTVIPF